MSEWPVFDICREGRSFLLGIVDLGILFDSQPVILVDIYRVRHLCFGLGRYQPRMLMKYPVWSVWVVKLGFFNIIYIPILILAPQLIYSGDLPSWMMVGLILIGNIIIVIFGSLYLRLEINLELRIQAFVRRR